LVESAEEGIVLIRGERCIACNSRATELLVCTREQLLAQTIGSAAIRGAADARSAVETAAYISARVRDGEQMKFEWRGERWDGTSITAACTAIRITEGRKGLMVLLFREVPSAAGDETPTVALLRVQDEERRRLARELHDSTGQILSALQMNLSVVAQAASKFAERQRIALKEALEMSNECMRDIRTLTYLLHPPLLEEFGLAPALKAFAEGFGQRTGIRVTLKITPGLRRLDSGAELALFRIVQESLTNIHRHSGSSVARIQVKRDGKILTLEVTDKGKGMPKPALVTGVGIPGMHERVKQLGGQLTIATGPSGTTILVDLPLKNLQPKQPDSPV
jgi:signal transduction histidine kinase